MVLRSSPRFRIALLAVALTYCGGRPAARPAQLDATPQPAPAPTIRTNPEVKPAASRPPQATLTKPPAPDTPTAPADSTVVVLGAPTANHSIRARGADLGLVLMLAAERHKLSIVAFDATTPVSVDLHYDDASVLLGRLETVGGIRRISKGLRTSRVTWFVPSHWPEPTAKVSLGRLSGQRVDLHFIHAAMPQMLALFADITGAELAGVSSLTQHALTLRILGVRCDQLLADILKLSGNSASFTGGKLTLRGARLGDSPPVAPEGNVAQCPAQALDPTLDPSASHRRAATGLACNRVDEVRLAAVAYEKRSRRGVAAIVPAAGRPGRHAFVRVGDLIVLRGPDGDPVELWVKALESDRVVLAGSQPSSRYALGLSLKRDTQTLTPLPVSDGGKTDASTVDTDCILDPELPKCAAVRADE